MNVMPVTFSPGRATLLTRPCPSGGPARKTTGMVAVAFFTPAAAVGLHATITSTFMPTSSAAARGQLIRAPSDVAALDLHVPALDVTEILHRAVEGFVDLGVDPGGGEISDPVRPVRGLRLDGERRRHQTTSQGFDERTALHAGLPPGRLERAGSRWARQVEPTPTGARADYERSSPPGG
jgi:hypothetical protein